jgi:PiT family inorganic phosphate transporter
MGVITLALVAATKAGALSSAPDWLAWLRTPEGTPLDHLAPFVWVMTHLPSWMQFGYQPPAVASADQFIPLWVTFACALTMAAGTASGGWRIIRTLGHKMVKLQPVHGFAAETSAATVLLVAARLGMPVSTTHAITSAIMGVGAAKRLNAIKWTVVERILWAWAMTLPAAGFLGWLLMRIVRAFSS